MLGYYAHDHGSGHLRFALLFAEALETVIFTARADTFPASLRVIALPDDLPDGTGLPLDRFPAPGFLHYAPLGMRKLRTRYERLLEGIERHDVELLIVDVSVEVAAFARLSGVPTAYVRLMGGRCDPPHLYAYEAAVFLLAYFPEALDEPQTPAWVREKTLYLGFFSRFDGRDGCPNLTPKPEADLAEGRPNIAVIQGSGGKSGGSPINFANLRRCFPDHHLIVLGSGTAPGDIADCRHLGHVPDPRPYLESADFVVGSCGANTTAEMATLGKRFVALPDERPFGEQAQMARALAGAGLCVQATTHEPDLATRIANLRPDWTPYVQPQAVSRFARWFKSRSGDVSAMADDVRHRRTFDQNPSSNG